MAMAHLHAIKRLSGESPNTRMSTMRWILLLLTSIGSVAPAATVWTWPGAAPCHQTLNDCLASAQAGDTVQIAGRQTISTALSLNAAVSIVAMPGGEGFFDVDANHFVRLPGTAPWTMTLRGLRFRRGTLSIRVQGTQPGTLVLEQLTMVQEATGATRQLTLLPEQTSSALTAVLVRNSSFESGTQSGAFTSILAFASNSGALHLTLEDCRFFPENVAMTPTTHSALTIASPAEFELVFRRNQVLRARTLSRGFASGVALNSTGGGTSRALIHDNLLLLDGDAGVGGTGVLAQGPIELRVLNNTIDFAYNGLALGAQVTGRIDNNIFSQAFRWHDGPAPASNFQIRSNLVFGMLNPSNWAIPSGTVTGDPQLTSAGMLRPGSPAINAGSNAARSEAGPGAQPAPEALDVLRKPRIANAQIDIGAVEGERVFYDGWE